MRHLATTNARSPTSRSVSPRLRTSSRSTSSPSSTRWITSSRRRSIWRSNADTCSTVCAAAVPCGKAIEASVDPGGPRLLQGQQGQSDAETPEARWGSREKTKTFKFDGMQSIAFEMFNKPISIFIDQGEKQPAERIAAYGDWNSQTSASGSRPRTCPRRSSISITRRTSIYVSDLPDMPKARKGAASQPRTRGERRDPRQLRSQDRTHHRDPRGWLVHRHGRDVTPGVNGYGFHDFVQHDQVLHGLRPSERLSR